MEKAKGVMHKTETGFVSTDHDHIWFYDEVNTESVLAFNISLHNLSLSHVTNTYNSVLERGNPSPIWVHLNTPGGSVIDGLNMYDNIKRVAQVVPVAIIVEGQASSMGAIITQAGSSRFIRENGHMLIHEISGGHYGKLTRLTDDYINMKMFNAKLKKILIDATKIPATVMEKIFIHDLYFDAKKSKRYGMVDEII